MDTNKILCLAKGLLGSGTKVESVPLHIYEFSIKRIFRGHRNYCGATLCMSLFLRIYVFVFIGLLLFVFT